MKVKLLTTMAGPEGVYPPGSILETDDAYLIYGGFAELIDGELPDAEPIEGIELIDGELPDAEPEGTRKKQKKGAAKNDDELSGDAASDG